MEMKPKSLINDNWEIYLLKTAIEKPTVPFYIKLCALWFIPSHWLEKHTEFFKTFRDFEGDMYAAWVGLWNYDQEPARQVVMSVQRGLEAIQTMAKEELANPVSRMRIIIWLILIAAVVIIPLWLLSQPR